MIGLAILSAHADTVYVPGDADTLGEALALAREGDTIELATGEYREEVVVHFPVSIVGTGGPDLTRIEGQGGSDVITVSSDGVSITGLTLEAFGHAGVAVLGGEVTLTDVVVRRFGTRPDEDDNVAGVEAFGSEVTLVEVEFDGGDAGAALVAAQSTVVFDEVTVSGGVPFGSLATIEIFGGSFTATDLTVTGVVGAAAIRAFDAPVVLERVNVQCNDTTGPAVQIVGPSAEITALIVADTPTSPLLELLTASPSVVRNTTLVASSEGGSLVTFSGDTLDVWSSILVGVSAPIDVKDEGKLAGGWNLFDAEAAIPPGLEADPRSGDPRLVADGRACTTPLAPDAGSPAIDAGDPADPDRNGTRNDLGATGGARGFVVDLDNDGARSDVDCDDTDPARYPGADDPPNDGVDQDCSDDGPLDNDGDGSPAGEDCDDTDPSIYPGADEVWYDGVDQDCSGGQDTDADEDGFDALAAGGSDCDDGDPAIHPGADEDLDPVDRDCDGYGDPTGVFGPAGCTIAGRSSGVLVFLVFLALSRRSNVPRSAP